MPPKRVITYPRYFQGSEPCDKTAIIVFPAEGSLGTTYYTDLKRWSHTPNWLLSEMKAAPVDEEIGHWQAVSLGVPTNKLPAFRAEPNHQNEH